MPDSQKLDGAPRRLLVIFNPTAGGRRRRRLDAVLTALAARGCSLDVRPTRGPGDAAVLARQADPAAHDLIVAAGGDGTINEVINGLVEGAGEGASARRLPLAVLPLGTANVLAVELGLDLVPDRIARIIAEGPVRPVSLGRIDSGDGTRRVFSLMVGAGFDARVVAGVDLRVKRLIGKGAYVLGGLHQLCRRQSPPLEVTVDGRVYEVASVIVSRARFYGGRYLLAPEARLDDPSFQVCLFRYGGMAHTLRYAFAMLGGRLAGMAGFEIVTGREIRIEGPRGEPLQADGDDVARLPVDITILPVALEMVIAG